MELNEFIDAYSDDLTYLREGRTALLTHPLRRDAKVTCDASYCRMFATVMIGSIEMMLSEWRNRDECGVLDMWFAEQDETGKTIRNGDRVKALYNAFHRAGIQVDKDVFDDFLAIKYLRNTIVHSSWKNYEKRWLAQRGFPSDSRKLTEKHWDRMQSVNDNMMLYIALTSIAKTDKTQVPARPIRLPESDLPEASGIVRQEDMPIIFWQNMGRISERIYRAIEQATALKKYNWANNLSAQEINDMPDVEKKFLHYKAARKAGEESLDVLVRQKELTQEALFSWGEYKRFTFSKYNVTPEDVTEAARTINSLHDKGVYFKGPPMPFRIDDMPAEKSKELIQFLLEGYSPLTEGQIVAALKTGRAVYEIVPNITPALVFNVLLPIVDPPNTEMYLKAGDEALAATELGVAWHWYVEHKSPPDAENLVLYRRIRNTFSQSAHKTAGEEPTKVDRTN